MRNKRFIFALIMGLIFMSACATPLPDEPQTTPTPTPDSTPIPTPTPTPLPEIAVSELPESEFSLHELYPEKVTKIQLEVSYGYDQVLITVEDEQKISEFLDAIGHVELTATYEPLFLEGEYDVRLSLYEKENELISFDEDSSYVEFIVENAKYKKAYAVKDEKARRNTVLFKTVNSMFDNYILTLNNGMYDIDFVPLHVQSDGYVLTSELGQYSWPVFNFETIDFSEYTLSIDNQVITELPEEPGEYILVVDNGAGKYQIKIYVD